ncbi:MAG: zinc metallopeptidase [Bacteroidales bacterium]|jgi:Zn-dependent membrane protease YugP
MEVTSTVSLYWMVFIGIVLLSWVVQVSLQSKFRKYSRITISAGLTGAEVARKMLQENGITDVQVISVRGRLTDHFNPITRTVNLSEGVYASRSVMAAAVAAHECGHAVQHATGYAPLKMRSALVPAVHFASQWVMWLILAGMFMINTFPQLMLTGIVLFALTTLFSFITLPVEINASKRALVWLNTSGITDYETYPMAKEALKSAAYTYVVAALSSLATLFYYISLFSGSKRR